MSFSPESKERINPVYLFLFEGKCYQIELVLSDVRPEQGDRAILPDGRIIYLARPKTLEFMLDIWENANLSRVPKNEISDQARELGYLIATVAKNESGIITIL